jgi:molecular chaperone HtpG
MSVETYEFQAEINQLMSLIINAFYSNKEIFLRELISNSSDALDKIRHASLTDKSVIELEPDLYIHLKIDKEAKSLTISDTGVGMTKSELINNLGTIARSGTKAFMESLHEGNGDMSLIGQFGVGFYSAYLVADSVTVTTKHNDSDIAYTWKSEAGGSFTISPCDDFELKRGTKIVLNLKDDQSEYLDETRLQTVVKTHSGYINYPISYWKTITETKEVPDDDNETKEVPDDDNETKEVPDDDNTTDSESIDEVEGEVEDETTESKPAMKKITETRYEWSQINNQKPIWTSKTEDVTKEEYEAFYKSLTNDWDTCAKWNHFHVEGQLEFTGLLYVPKRAPFDLFDKKEKQNNLKLYVRRVFITDDCKDLVPEYLSFVKGLVDSEDLPLNVSREILQQNKILKVIKKNVVKKCLEMFDNLAEDPEEYKTFYENYSKNLKLGVHEDSQNRNKLVNLLRFASAKCDFGSLQDYCKSMPEDQKSIYYITGESVNAVRNSPFVEVISKKGFDVLYLTDPIDEYAVQQMKEYTYEEKSYKLVNITKEGIDFDAVSETDVKDYEKTCSYIKECLTECDGGVEKVVLSNRIVDSPCVLVTGEYGWSANMERIMKAQALGSNQNNMFMSGKKTLEVNKDHNIVCEIHRRVCDVSSETKYTDSGTKDLVILMYQSSLLASGFNLSDPQAFNKRIVRMIQLGLSLDEVEETEAAVEEIVDNDEENTMEEVD